MSLPDRFCVLPWIHADVSTSGVIAPCCEYKGEIGNLNDNTLSDIWNGAPTAEVRKEFLSGQAPAACIKCFEREASGETSLRMRQNLHFREEIAQIEQAPDPLAAASPFPISMDLRFSNLCNFKCRSCWYGSSSKWFADATKLGHVHGGQAVISSFDGVDDFMSQLGAGLTGLKSLYFAGGEPLLLAEHYALLEKLVEIGRTDIALAYNSNMSTLEFRDRSILDLWKEFPAITLEASVDATGALGANMRSGFAWETFVANVNLVRRECPQVQINYGITVSIMNMLALPELFDALESECDARLDQMHPHSLQEQPLYRTQVMPAGLKKKSERTLRRYLARNAKRSDLGADQLAHITHKIDGIIAFMMAQDLTAKFPEFVALTKRLDALRQDNSAEDFGALGAYLDDPSAGQGVIAKLQRTLAHYFDRNVNARP